jgi:hypothetical protein
LLVFAEVSLVEGSADPPVRGGWDAAGRAAGAVGAGPVNCDRLFLDEQRRVVDSGETHLVCGKFLSG